MSQLKLTLTRDPRVANVKVPKSPKSPEVVRGGTTASASVQKESPVKIIPAMPKLKSDSDITKPPPQHKQLLLTTDKKKSPPFHQTLLKPRKSPPPLIKLPKSAATQLLINTLKSTVNTKLFTNPSLLLTHKEGASAGLATYTIATVSGPPIPKLSPEKKAALEEQELTPPKPKKPKNSKTTAALPISRIKTIMKTNTQSLQNGLQLSQDSVLVIAKAAVSFAHAY